MIRIVVTPKFLLSQEGFLHICHLILGILTILGLHISGDLYDLDDPSNTYWSGAVWGIVVGLVGLAALAVVISSLFILLPRKFIKWYYLAAAIIIFTIASFGLGLNQSVESYYDCKAKMKDSAEKVEQTLPRFRTRCGYDRLFPTFTIYIISVWHTVLYGVSFCIALLNKPSMNRPKIDDNNSATTASTAATYGDSSGPSSSVV